MPLSLIQMKSGNLVDVDGSSRGGKNIKACEDSQNGIVIEYCPLQDKIFYVNGNSRYQNYHYDNIVPCLHPLRLFGFGDTWMYSHIHKTQNNHLYARTYGFTILFQSYRSAFNVFNKYTSQDIHIHKNDYVYKPIIIISSKYKSKQDAYDDIQNWITFTLKDHRSSASIYGVDFNCNNYDEIENKCFVFTFQEFDDYLRHFARGHVHKHQQTLLEPLTKTLGVSNNTINSLQEQILRLEERLHDMEICIQQHNNSDESSDTSTEDNDEITLTPKNIVEHAIEYHKEYNLCNADIVETIQLMLASRKYVLSKEMLHNKVDFAQANTLFLVGVAPTKLDKMDLQNLIFKNVICESLI